MACSASGGIKLINFVYFISKGGIVWSLEIKSWVPELRSRYCKRERYTKLRRQVKQARTANKKGRCTGAAHLL